MTTATCTRECFDSKSATLYKVGDIAEVDETDGWVQNNFDVPKTKKKADPDDSQGPKQPGKAKGKPE